MQTEKKLMVEAAVLYYEQKLTQQEIANRMGLTRQTVSKLLSEAVEEKVVEITIHNPEHDCSALEAELCETFGIADALVCSVSNSNEALRQTMTVRAAADYLKPLFLKGGQKIALSWGRTVQALIDSMPLVQTAGNVVFPLFGATDQEHSCFASNELARSMADKLGAAVKYAWFPYMADNDEDRALLQKLSYYKKLQALWQTADIAIVGIGNTEVLDIFGKTFGYSKDHAQAIGDVATHFYDENGAFVNLYPHSLCASAQDLKAAKQTIAIACGDHKAKAIVGALRTGLIHTLITDEYTAKKVLSDKH